MILYRARSLSARPSRLPAFAGNEPATRIRGRWFTSVLADAIAHGQAHLADSDYEIVSVEVPDALVDSYRVATTPHTPCGLSPVDYADKPETEYVLPMFRVMEAVVAANGETRQRDYILVDEPRTAQILPIATKKKLRRAA